MWGTVDDEQLYPMTQLISVNNWTEVREDRSKDHTTKPSQALSPFQASRCSLNAQGVNALPNQMLKMLMAFSEG